MCIRDRVLFLADGRIVDEMRQPTAESVLERMKRFDIIRATTDDTVTGAAPAGDEPTSGED